MNEQTEQNINEAIDWLQQTGASLQDFATTQAPLYCQELISYHTALAWLGVACGALLLALAFVGLSLAVFRKSWDGETRGGLGLVAGIILIFAVGLSLTQAIQLVKIKTAPRVVIVEHLKEQAQ